MVLEVGTNPGRDGPGCRGLQVVLRVRCVLLVARHWFRYTLRMGLEEVLERLLSFGAAFVAVFATAFAAFVAYLRYRAEQRHQQDVFLNALFGELTSLYEHYHYAGAGLPRDNSSIPELSVLLRYSLYGELRSVEDVTRCGFLTANDIRLLLQLGLRVRNNDVLVRLLLEDPDLATQPRLLELRRRMAFTIETTRHLIARLCEWRPALKEVLDKIEPDLPWPVGDDYTS